MNLNHMRLKSTDCFEEGGHNRQGKQELWALRTSRPSPQHLDLMADRFQADSKLQNLFAYS